MPLTIDIYSDVICPWCWVGKRRLEQALVTIAPITATIKWHPFQLNPEMPQGGMTRADYRKRKFGSADYAAALDERVTKVAAEAGLAFDLAGQSRTPNTVLAHRLIWLAGQHGIQNTVVEALFSAYFSAGLNVGDKQILTTIVSNAVTADDTISTDIKNIFSTNNLITFLSGNDGSKEIHADEQFIRGTQIDGVPLFIINGTERINGAQPIAVFTAILNNVTTTMTDGDDCDDGLCKT